ncbi:unnamed protein product [Lepeophtheirus salmonis]|uniref:(salmon louse) hypothetical protein n=1 Tax=Lepeophtheirus salmonis TaxID=72036 RepID=A0A7R8CCY1_LEPSM|nr:unnamed protein product [Lepeophtheirus salmonis]CAF2773953.1 unnamed protein product [Lepeophtheirus salmonis]
MGDQLEEITDEFLQLAEQLAVHINDNEAKPEEDEMDESDFGICPFDNWETDMNRDYSELLLTRNNSKLQDEAIGGCQWFFTFFGQIVVETTCYSRVRLFATPQEEKEERFPSSSNAVSNQNRHHLGYSRKPEEPPTARGGGGKGERHFTLLDLSLFFAHHDGPHDPCSSSSPCRLISQYILFTLQSVTLSLLQSATTSFRLHSLLSSIPHYSSQQLLLWVTLSMIQSLGNEGSVALGQQERGGSSSSSNTTPGESPSSMGSPIYGNQDLTNTRK